MIASDGWYFLDAIVRKMRIGEAEPLPGVEATLDVLGERHALGLVTRGDPAEQWAKIDASGLRGRFRHIEVVRDKDEATYRRLVEASTEHRGQQKSRVDIVQTLQHQFRQTDQGVFGAGLTDREYQRLRDASRAIITEIGVETGGSNI